MRHDLNPSFALGADNILRCVLFDQFGWQRHGFGTRHASPLAQITLRQVHSDRVFDARGLTNRSCEGDALVSREIGQSIGIRTADCVPILLLYPEHRAVAAVHAGWRGTADAILLRTLETMRREFGTAPESVYAAIGPAIQACCYEVGSEVSERFAPLFPEWPAEPGRRNVDLPEANRRHLMNAGVPNDHIYNCGLCTHCHAELFFSYRREPQNPGRMLSSIGVFATDA
ncbi:MAG TPA: peptidoglycan editing factor PgeF [Bryobacteraceae bacterium]|nr:peptidoglycan editing factor PgeF [Bryobacteraceae bacterium]